MKRSSEEAVADSACSGLRNRLMLRTSRRSASASTWSSRPLVWMARALA